MESFAQAVVSLPAVELQRHIRIDNLADWCPAISGLVPHSGERGSIVCQWGEECRVHREVIRHGLRFTLPGTEHALQWTLTTPVDRPGVVIVHCTADAAHEQADLAAEIELFVRAWKEGIEAGANKLKADRAAKAAALPSCTPWFG